MKNLTNKKIIEKVIDYTGKTSPTSDLEDKTAKTQIPEQLNYQFVVDPQQYTIGSLAISGEASGKTDVDEELVREISNINYKPVLTSAI